MTVHIPVAKGDYLSEYGWTVHLKADDRRTRLVKAVNKHGYAPISQRLNAIAIRLKNTAPVSSRTARYDQQWLAREYGRQK
jgi:hypothetical protein